MRPEDHLAQQISRYLHIQYSQTIYHFDTGSGGRTSIGMAMRNKNLNWWQGYPDLFICEARHGFNGLFIELKVKSPFKKDGSILKNEHLQNQHKIHQQLKAVGYEATFGVGFDHCKMIIDWYLNNGETPKIK